MKIRRSQNSTGDGHEGEHRAEQHDDDLELMQPLHEFSV
jgi:hypothetical protein